jgi:catechol 2,3-dioxygenase-like lactoylglutathione lyase family enzyme
MPAIRGLVEVVLIVDDIDRSLTFYCDALGLELISPPHIPAKFLRIGPPSDGIPYQIVLVPRTRDHGLPTGQVLHHIGLAVAPEEYEAERAHLERLGFVLRTGKHPFMPVDAFYLDDPDGNEIEIATWRG